MNYEYRLKSAHEIIRRRKIDGLFVSNIKNVRYLTGFSGSSGFALITGDKDMFFTDFRYKLQAEREVNKWEINLEKSRRINAIKKIIKKAGIKRLCFEKSLAYEFYEQLKRLPVTLTPGKNLIEDLRKTKSEEEIENIKRAVERSERAFKKIKPRLKVGVKEREIALRLEAELKKSGCRGIPFDIMVASGKNSSLPHARPTEKRIERGDFVIIDWGGEAGGYYSDMTRTFLMYGSSLSEKIRIYNSVNEARKKAIESIRSGIKTKDVDAAARNAIKEAGYGDYFGHGTGHGVGLDVHESPRVSWNDGEVIKNGMVFTVEPGIYIPELGGVRIEDMALVKDEGAVTLTTLNRELEIIK